MDVNYISILKEYINLIVSILGKSNENYFYNDFSKKKSSNIFTNKFIDEIEDLKDMYDEYLKNHIEEQINETNKIIDKKIKNEIIKLYSTPTSRIKDSSKEIDRIFKKYERKRATKISSIIRNTIDTAENDKENPVVKQFYKFGTQKKSIDRISKIKNNIILCSKVYPEMSNTWEVVESKFPHLRDEEINELITVLYRTINSNLKENKNLAFTEFDDKNDLKLKIIELKYVLNKAVETDQKNKK